MPLGLGEDHVLATLAAFLFSSLAKRPSLHFSALSFLRSDFLSPINVLLFSPATMTESQVSCCEGRCLVTAQGREEPGGRGLFLSLPKSTVWRLQARQRRSVTAVAPQASGYQTNLLPWLTPTKYSLGGRGGSLTHTFEEYWVRIMDIRV